jgi:hypothetical protein
MKVEVLKDEYGPFEIAVKKRKKIIRISTLAEDDFTLDTGYFVPDSIKCNNSLTYGWLGLTITWSKDGIKITNFRDKEVSNMIAYSYLIGTFNDKINFGLLLHVYYVSCVKEKK